MWICLWELSFGRSWCVPFNKNKWKQYPGFPSKRSPAQGLLPEDSMEESDPRLDPSANLIQCYHSILHLQIATCPHTMTQDIHCTPSISCFKNIILVGWNTAHIVSETGICSKLQIVKKYLCLMATVIPHSAQDWPQSMCYKMRTQLLFSGGGFKALCSEGLHTTQWGGEHHFKEQINFAVLVQPTRSPSCNSAPVPALILTQDEQVLFI